MLTWGGVRAQRGEGIVNRTSCLRTKSRREGKGHELEISQKSTEEINPGLLGSKGRALIAAVVKRETGKKRYKDRQSLGAPRDDRHHSDAWYFSSYQWMLF